MKKCLIVVLTVLIAQTAAVAQYSRYIIRLKDKAGSSFNIASPSAFLSQRSIERRIRYNIPLDSTDLPVNEFYIDSIRLAGNVTILNVSKWLNQVCILTTDADALKKINAFTFVITTQPIAQRQQAIPTPVNKQLSEPGKEPEFAAKPLQPAGLYDYGQAAPQINLHQGGFLHDYGFRGEGMQVAIMDAGFYHYQSLPTFDSVRNNGQVLSTWDFVSNEADVDEDNAHGMNCFSTMAANMPGSFIGTAPKSSYHLYRTEDVSSEYPVEEQNFAAAAEKADSLGADIFSISLGYNTFDNSSLNHTYADMDGNTTIITRASDLAAQKGILVAVAAGNDGNDPWHFISAPADADSVLSVGAVNVSGQPAAFSSYGPTSDGRIKPDVAAIGQGAVVANQLTGDPSYNNGTSFACPIMAGIATCLWQAFPEVNNMRIIEALRRSSNKYQSPDDRTGYGIPDAKLAFVSLLKSTYTQQLAIDNSCKTIINWSVKSGAGMNIIIERKLPYEPAFTPLATKSFTGSFAIQPNNYTDDLSSLPTGMEVVYRLKMTIGSDTSFYLDSAVLVYDGTCAATGQKIVIGPNPVNNNLNVLVTKNEPGKVSVIVHSITGQSIYKTEQQVTGLFSFSIPMKQVSKGVYFVSVYFDDKKQVVKKIVRL